MIYRRERDSRNGKLNFSEGSIFDLAAQGVTLKRFQKLWGLNVGSDRRTFPGCRGVKYTRKKLGT